METQREILISKGWIKAAALVGLCGFLLLGFLAYRAYKQQGLRRLFLLNRCRPKLQSGFDSLCAIAKIVHARIVNPFLLGSEGVTSHQPSK